MFLLVFIIFVLNITGSSPCQIIVSSSHVTQKSVTPKPENDYPFDLKKFLSPAIKLLLEKKEDYGVKFAITKTSPTPSPVVPPILKPTTTPLSQTTASPTQQPSTVITPGSKVTPSPLAPSSSNNPVSTPSSVITATPIPVTKATPTSSSIPSNLISVNFVEADIKDILTMFSKQSGINIIVSPGVKATVTVGLNNLSLEDAIKAILLSADLTYQMVGNTYVVMPLGEPVKSFMPIPSSIKTKKGNITLNLKDTDLQYILENLSNQTGVDIIMFGAIHDKLTVRLTDKPLDEALKMILSGTKFGFAKYKDIYIIGDATNLAGAASTLVQTKSYPLKYLKVKDAFALLPTTIPQANLKINELDNSFIVTGTTDIMDKMEEFMKEVDKPTRQVMLETAVLELNRKASKQLGLSFSGNLTSNITGSSNPFQIIYDDTKTNTTSMQITLKALIETGDARIRANPSVAASNGKEAMINVGKVVNVKVTTGTQLAPVTSLQTINAGITLKMTPVIGSTGEIIIDLSTEVSAITAVGVEGLPEISTRKANTTIRVKDGQTIAIGGLIQNDDINSDNKIPILGDIPLIGSLFGSRTKTENESELVILITPRLIKEGENLSSPLEQIIPKGVK